MDNNQAKKIYQKKWFWIFVAVFVLIIITSSGSPKSTDANQNTNKQVNSEQQKEEALKVTAKQLSADYNSNEVAADQKYKGKLVEVTGILKSIQVVLGSQFITIEGNDFLTDIQCYFDKSKESELATLQKDKSITVQGRVSGKSLNVEVKSCEIVK